MTIFFVGSLVLIFLGVWGAGLALPWSLAAGFSLLALWILGLKDAPLPRKHPARLLPGHSLLLFGAGQVGTKLGLYLWFSALGISLLLLWPWGPRLSRTLWAILWFVLAAVIHQLVAIGRGLEGIALWIWTGGVAILALLLAGKEARRNLKEGVMK